MAEAYGKTPAEMLMLDAPGQDERERYSPMERFRINQDIFRATAEFKDDHRNGTGTGAAESGAGTASAAEKRELIRRNERRAAEREAAEDSHGHTEGPSPDEQLQHLGDVLDERDRAASALDGDSTKTKRQ